MGDILVETMFGTRSSQIHESILDLLEMRMNSYKFEWHFLCPSSALVCVCVGGVELTPESP